MFGHVTLCRPISEQDFINEGYNKTIYKRDKKKKKKKKGKKGITVIYLKTDRKIQKRESVLTTNSDRMIWFKSVDIA